MNLMIVEDEALLRNSLVHSMDWAANEIEIVGAHSNGLEALKHLEHNRPDIILLDIQMPEMDGLTLAARIVEWNPMIKIILMSGHDDFQYAQKAIDLRVSNYLLKPAGDKEILNAVVNAAQEIKVELAKKHDQSIMQQQWKENLPRLQEMFLQNWVHDKFDDWQISRRSLELGISLSMEHDYCLAVAEMDPLSEHETRFGNNDHSLLQFSLQSIAKDYFPQSCKVFTDWSGATLILFDSISTMNAMEFQLFVHTSCSKFIYTVEQILKLTASVGIGGISQLASVQRSYKQARLALQMRVIYGDNLAIPYMEPASGKSQLTFKESFEKDLWFALEAGQMEARSASLIQEFIENLNLAATVDEVEEIVFLTSSLFIRWIQSQQWPVKDVVQEDYAYFSNHDLLVSKEQISQWFERCLRHIDQYTNQQGKSGGHQLIKSVVSLVQELMDQDLTLHAIASMLYVNSSYLSRLFKQETSKSFSTYVLDKKMERASSLLNEGARVYDAARMVGYRDVSYFTKVFRKYWGITPGEVRK
ncbi:response regulator [Paenibacillus psychroresistens]|uniref:Response regulator n=1 Tax=Paenibacillus psychroresistens TaxID=1778678 RepID=A0A6B8RRH5_9BACL|nr:response regulator [Paenibacillus psychroresistens]QGQ98312.1 response regulator [Paenibacillus psychroresistens]